MHIVHIVHIGFNWVWAYLGSLGLILVDLGDLGYRVLNLENESTGSNKGLRGSTV